MEGGSGDLMITGLGSLTLEEAMGGMKSPMLACKAGVSRLLPASRVSRREPDLPPFFRNRYRENEREVDRKYLPRSIQTLPGIARQATEDPAF
jgi:hypothetical protein